MTEPSTIRLFLVDDHPVVREGLRLLLETEPGFEVVGDASDGESAVTAVPSADPDVLLLDLELPGIDGVSVIERLAKTAPEVAVIVFTAFDTDDRIFAAVRAGARGYLLKGAPRDELFDAIRTVHDGGSLLHPVAASKLMQRVSEGTMSPRVTLSSRESQVLELMAKGLQNREIAQQLGIAERTVKFHASSLFAKLDATNRTEAVAAAFQLGILRP